MEPLDKFFAMLGHELRNPLAAIIAALNVLREREGGLQRETQVIERQANHLARVVQDLLDVARISQGSIPLLREHVELETAFAHAAEIAGPQVIARRHSLAVDVESGLVVDADPVRLAQVLSHLLFNAAAFTPRGGRLELAGRREGEHALITVRDNGIGVTLDELPTIFERFVQGRKSPDRAEGGFGIGLTITKTIVELHGGTIVVLSQGANQGTEVVVRMPCVAA